MAIAFLRIRPISKGKGESSGNLHDYITRSAGWESKANLDESILEYHSKPPSGFDNMREFFHTADTYERANGTTARELTIAIPKEFSMSEAIQLNEQIAKHFEQTRYVSSVVHFNPDNPHIHLLMGERQRDDIERLPEIYFKQHNKKDPENSGAPKFDNASKARRAFLANAREVVETETNKILASKNLELISFANASENSAPHLGAKLHQPMLKALAEKERDPEHDPVILKHPKVIKYLAYQESKRELEEFEILTEQADLDRAELKELQLSQSKEKQSANLMLMKQKHAKQKLTNDWTEAISMDKDFDYQTMLKEEEALAIAEIAQHQKDDARSLEDSEAQQAPPVTKEANLNAWGQVLVASSSANNAFAEYAKLTGAKTEKLDANDYGNQEVNKNDRGRSM